MDLDDLDLIRRYIDQDAELKHLIDEHNKLETEIEALNNRSYLSSEEAQERKRLQKLKLAGRDRIEARLTDYRKRGS